MGWRTVVATVLLVCGTGIEVVAVLGLCALRDLYDRVHYVGLVGYGALLTAVAIVFKQSFSLIGDKALLVGGLLAAGGVVLAHTTIRSLLIRERGDWREAIDDATQDGGS